MNDDVGYMLKKVNDRIHIQADANLKECGLTFSQMRVLMVLRKNGGQVSQKMIEEELGVAHPTVVGIFSRLEKNGFVSCYMDRQTGGARLSVKLKKHWRITESIKSRCWKLRQGFLLDSQRMRSGN